MSVVSNPVMVPKDGNGVWVVLERVRGFRLRLAVDAALDRLLTLRALGGNPGGCAERLPLLLAPDVSSLPRSAPSERSGEGPTDGLGKGDGGPDAWLDAGAEKTPGTESVAEEPPLDLAGFLSAPATSRWEERERAFICEDPEVWPPSWEGPPS